jgi:hypothetical protein
MRVSTTSWLLFACILCSPVPFASKARADIIRAGITYVDLSADHVTAGTSTWHNSGTLGDFHEYGDPVLTQIGGQNAVTFDGSSAYIGPSSVPHLEGWGYPRSIEVWAFNPAVSSEEPLVSWGHFGGPTGSLMVFGFGSHDHLGAACHWGDDLGWNGAPTAGEWHHLAYTYDGVTAKVYSDGVEKNSKDLFSDPHTHSGDPILLATLNTLSPGFPWFASLSIAQVRIHGGALSAADVWNNYQEDAARYAIPEPTTMTLLGLGLIGLAGMSRKRLIK